MNVICIYVSKLYIGFNWSKITVVFLYKLEPLVSVMLKPTSMIHTKIILSNWYTVKHEKNSDIHEFSSNFNMMYFYMFQIEYT